MSTDMSTDMSTAAARPAARAGLGAVAVTAAGLVSGVLGALAGGDEHLRPLAHLVGPWVLLAAVVSAGRRPGPAAARSTLVLLGAVVAFYVTSAAVRTGAVRTGRLTLWCGIALVSGVALGLLFHRVGRGGPLGVAGAAAALGIVLADAVHETRHYGPDPVLLGVAGAGACAALVLARPTGRELVGIAALTWPAYELALAVVTAPDTLENLLLFR